jgi:hypothetical protein
MSSDDDFVCDGTDWLWETDASIIERWNDYSMKILRHPDDPDYSGHLNEGDDADEQPRVRSMHSSVNFADAEMEGCCQPTHPLLTSFLSMLSVSTELIEQLRSLSTSANPNSYTRVLIK